MGLVEGDTVSYLKERERERDENDGWQHRSFRSAPGSPDVYATLMMSLHAKVKNGLLRKKNKIKPAGTKKHLIEHEVSQTG